MKDMRPVQEALAAQYKYKPLPPLFSMLQRQEYIDNVPECFQNYNGEEIVSLSGVPICKKLTDRVYVCGDYGVFLEADEKDMYLDNLMIAKGQEYRVSDEKYIGHVKYIWLSPKSGTKVKIYFQQKEVLYADYKVGKYYFSPYEVKVTLHA